MLNDRQVINQIIANSIKLDSHEFEVSRLDYDKQIVLKAMLRRGYLKRHNDVYLLMSKSIAIWKKVNAKKSN